MTTTAPASINDPTNARILTISEDKVQGFHRYPFREIATRSDLDLDLVLNRIRLMLETGTIRRVRQTLMATNLARGALVAWRVPADQLNHAFEWVFTNDPFTGHVVIRSTDTASIGADYRLWTTLKVPQGYSMQQHGKYLATQIGADDFHFMPAKKLFSLGVGHMRRRNLKPGDRSDAPGHAKDTEIVTLSDREWRILTALKRELDLDEVTDDLWQNRAEEAGETIEDFCEIADSLNQRGVIGRFSTFLEHVKPTAGGAVVTRYNGLFHWRVPPGREIDAGLEVGRHHVMTHAYWREGGERFNNVNVMGVAHGLEKAAVLEHKAAIDEHLREAGIDFDYTNVFWGGRSEIKPSEISPVAYVQWCQQQRLDPETMRESGPTP